MVSLPAVQDAEPRIAQAVLSLPGVAMSAGSWLDVIAPEAAVNHAGSGALREKFVHPPFSILDRRQGYWRDRRHQWLNLGIMSELGRGLSDPHKTALPIRGNIGEVERGIARNRAERAMRVADARAFSNDLMKGDVESAGISVFDPVICELVYRWFTPERGVVLDPFAGGSVRGIVAGYLGHPYHGIELRPEQVHSNRAQAEQIMPGVGVMPEWYIGDSLNMSMHLQAGFEADLVFTCPPYADLEVYSDDPRDLSRVAEGPGGYEKFIGLFGEIMRMAVHRLRPGRFAAVVVSEIRDTTTGHYRGFVPDTIALMRAAGMAFYNDLIIVDPTGSAPQRANRQFSAGRKVVRCHQNLLVFVKGDPERGWSFERDAPPDPQIALW